MNTQSLKSYMYEEGFLLSQKERPVYNMFHFCLKPICKSYT